jgi:pimeloyl-ACP methyl ester carboxylesterase
MRVQGFFPPKNQWPRWSQLTIVLAAALGCGAWLAAGPALGQTRPDKKPETAAPEDLVRTTGDGLQLVMTYYPGVKNKQNVPIPVVLFHGWKQSRADYRRLALVLQAQGYAVLVPDLRGHGDSKTFKGSEKKLEVDRPSPKLSNQILNQDLRTIKEFLWKKNNEGELNIDKLCLVGAEMGASVALNFAMADAAEQDGNSVPSPNYKVGRFVKALVLISPTLSFAGLPVRPALQHPYVRHDIAMWIIVGADEPKSLDAAKRIHGMVEKSHPKPEEGSKVEQTLFFDKVDTKLQGTKLLDFKFGAPPNETTIPDRIAVFIDGRLAKTDDAKDWTWHERKFPHEQ